MADDRNFPVVASGNAGRTGDLVAGGIARPSELATNRVLRNTYLLLAATLLFSAVMAVVAMVTGMPYLGRSSRSSATSVCSS